MKLGLKSAVMPKAKPGDFERALQLAATFGSKDAVTRGLKELQDAAAALDQARDDAQATAAAATKRDTMAREAEAAATHARQALADETAVARAELGSREVKVAEREQAADARDAAQETRDEELGRREGLLREAGVANF